MSDLLQFIAASAVVFVIFYGAFWAGYWMESWRLNRKRRNKKQ